MHITQMDNLILFCRRKIWMFELAVTGDKIPLKTILVPEQDLQGPVVEFHSSSSFSAWTTKGNIFKLRISATGDNDARIVWQQEGWCHFVDVTFVKPEEDIFVGLDDSGRVHAFNSKSQNELSSYDLRIDLKLNSPCCTFVFAHPHLPIVSIGGADGRLISVAVISDADRVDFTVVGELALHTTALEFAVVEECGKDLAVIGSGGLLFLVDLGRPFTVSSAVKLEGKIVDTSFSGDTVVCLFAFEDSGGIARSGGGGRQICHLHVGDSGDLAVVNMIHMRDLCSGLALEQGSRNFFTFLVKQKVLAKFELLSGDANQRRSKPSMRKSLHHQLGLNGMKMLKGTLVTLGKDGMACLLPVSLLSNSGNGDAVKVVRLFHYRRGGLKSLDVTADPLAMVAVDFQGSLHLFKAQSNEKTKIAETRPKAIPTPLKQQSPDELAATPWSKWNEDKALAAEKQNYEAEIIDIVTSLDKMRIQVRELLESNAALPESERLEGAEFELNSEEKQRRVISGEEREASLRLELRAWQVARRKAGLVIRKQVWDSMEVKGLAVEGIHENVVVRNYPLLPLSENDLKDLELAMEERKLSLEMTGLVDQLHNCPTEALPSPRSHMESPQQHLILSTSPSAAVSRQASTVAPSPIPTRERQLPLQEELQQRYLGGSRSHAFIDVKACLLMDQQDITTRMQITQQMSLLKNVVLRLKLKFNAEFDGVYRQKDEVLGAIQGWLRELERVQRSEEEQTERRCETTTTTAFNWSPSENPELDLPKLEPAAAVATEDMRTTAEIKSHPLSKFPSRDLAVETTQPPEFMQGEKVNVEFSPAEISASEEFKNQLEAHGRVALHDDRHELNEQIELERKIEDAVREFDKRVLLLYRTRLAVEKCVLAEELKILLHDRRLAVMDRFDKEERQWMYETGAAQQRKDIAERQLQEGRRALAEMQELLVKMSEQDKAMEKNFKREFPGLNYSQLEALLLSYRRRPKGSTEYENIMGQISSHESRRKLGGDASKVKHKDLKAKSVSSTLERMSNMFLGTALSKTSTSEGGGGNTATAVITLDELDHPSNCPESVELEDWKLHCQLRRRKIDSEIKIATLMSELAETEEAVTEREEAAEKSVSDLTETRARLDEWRKEKNHVINNVEVVLNLVKGQIEVSTFETEPNLQGAVLLTNSVIDKLNYEIERLGESKLAAMTESKDFRAGTKLLRWERDRLNLELEDLQAKWADIQQTKLSKESRLALQAESVLHQPSLTEDYENLDKTCTSNENYLAKRSKELDTALEDLRAMTTAKDEENRKLELEITELEVDVERERSEVSNRESQLKSLHGSDRLSRVMQRNRLLQKIKEQHDVILGLQEQLNTYMFKSFPSLG